MIKNWEYSEYYRVNRSKILNLIDKTLLSKQLILGQQVKRFEKNFSNFIGSKYGVGVGNCTDAIYIALKILKIGFGDEVITTSNTAIPTVLSLVNSGAKPRFVDIDDNYLIDVNKIEKNINKKTKAIIVVHLYGQSCDMDKIVFIAKKYKLKIIEDCAQSTGAKYKDIRLGNFGDFGCFSFYPTKVLGAYGDGGFITTNNKSYHKELLKFRYMGIENRKKYFATSLGINSRLDEIQASILNYKLKNIQKDIRARRRIADLYNKYLKNSQLKLPKEIKNNYHVYYQYVVSHDNRNLILNRIKKTFIANIIYPYPLHIMKPYSKYSHYDLRKTNSYSKKIFSLPMYPELSLSQIKNISSVILGKKIK